MNIFFIKYRLPYFLFCMISYSCSDNPEYHSYAYNTNFYYGQDCTEMPHVKFTNLIQKSSNLYFLFNSEELKRSASKYSRPTSYFSLLPGVNIITAGNDQGSLLAVKSLVLNTNEYLSIFALEDSTKRILFLGFKDSWSAPERGKSLIRFINLSRDRQIITLQGNGLKVNKELDYKQATAFMEVENGSYGIKYRDSRLFKNVHYKTQMELESGGIYTICSTGLTRPAQIEDAFRASIIQNY